MTMPGLNAKTCNYCGLVKWMLFSQLADLKKSNCPSGIPHCCDLFVLDAQKLLVDVTFGDVVWGGLAERLLKCACAKTWILFRSISMSRDASFGDTFGNQSFWEGFQAKTNILPPTVVHLFSPPSFHSTVVVGG